jgi:organic radical activating enzyme
MGMNFLDYPNIIALEVTNLCPMKCVHCPHGHSKIRNKGLMRWELFTSLIDDVNSWQQHAPNPPKIVLYGNGEPLIHPKIADCVQYCTARGLDTNLSTNIMLATKEQAHKLSEAGLKLIKLSFWGDNQEEYESRTVHQSFEEAITRAKEFIEHTSPAMNVVINIVKYRKLGQSLHPSPAFTEHFRSYPNVKFYCFYGSDWRGTLDIPELKVPLAGEPKHEPCKMAGEMIHISWHGKFVFCWLDYNCEYVLGDYFPGSLLTYWRSAERIRRLNIMAEGRFRDIEICRYCSAPYSEQAKERYYQDQERAEIIVGKHIYEKDFLHDPQGEVSCTSSLKSDSITKAI